MWYIFLSVFLLFFFIVLCFYGIAYSDATTFSIPNELLYPAWLCALLLLRDHPLFFQKAALSGCISFIFWCYKKKSETVGYGDIKLFALCTFILPSEVIPPFFLFCGFFGALYHRIRKKRICPLGPAIVLGFLLTLL